MKYLWKYKIPVPYWVQFIPLTRKYI